MIFCLIFGVCATAATGHQNCLLRIDTFHAAPDIFFSLKLVLGFFPLNYNDNAAFLVVPDICILAFCFH